MKSLSELILEADDQNQNNQDQGNNNNNDNQDNKNKSVKGDAGTYKAWPVFNTTVKGWIKVMSGQEEVKDSFFDGGFLVPTSVQGLDGNTQSKVATLSKQLDSQCKVAIVEFSNDYCFIIDGLKPYGKSMKSENTSNNSDNDNKNNGNKDDGNNSNGGTM